MLKIKTCICENLTLVKTWTEGRQSFKYIHFPGFYFLSLIRNFRSTKIFFYFCCRYNNHMIDTRIMPMNYLHNQNMFDFRPLKKINKIQYKKRPAHRKRSWKLRSECWILVEVNRRKLCHRERFLRELLCLLLCPMHPQC